MTPSVTRRDFVRNATLAAAGAAASFYLPRIAPAGVAPPEEVKKTRSYNEKMEYRRLGKTGLWISAVALGGHWKRVNTAIPRGTALEKNREEILRYCLSVGINYVDACTNTEVRTYGQIVKNFRDKIYFGYSCAQTEPREAAWRTADALTRSLEEGLKSAGVDYVDVWRITMHDRGSKHTDDEADEMAKALDRARKAGKTRVGGFSSHDRPWIQKNIEKYPDAVQVVLFPYTAASKELPQESLFDAVRKLDVGVLGIKPFASNSLFKGDSSPDSPHREDDDQRARLAIRYILSNPAITAPIPGLISTAQVDNMVAAIKERRELDAAEKAQLRRDADRAMANLPPNYQWLRDWEYV